MRDYVDRRGIPPKRVTSPTGSHPPPCEQALIQQLLTGPYPSIYWLDNKNLSLRVFTGENLTELKLSNVKSFIVFRSGKNLTSFNNNNHANISGKNKVNVLLVAVLDLV